MAIVYGGSFAGAVVLAVRVGGMTTGIVICDCCRLWLLLIVQGLICAESLGFFFLPLHCPLARRFRPRVVASVMGGAPFCPCLLVVLQPGLSPCGVREVTDEYICVVGVVSECLRGRKRSEFSGSSFTGSGAPHFLYSRQ